MNVIYAAPGSNKILNVDLRRTCLPNPVLDISNSCFSEKYSTKLENKELDVTKTKMQKNAKAFVYRAGPVSNRVRKRGRECCCYLQREWGARGRGGRYLFRRQSIAAIFINKVTDFLVLQMTT